jgi:hypothetical protein
VRTLQRIDDKVNDTRMLKLFEAISKIQMSRYLVKSEVFVRGIRIIIIRRVGTSGFHPRHVERARTAGSYDQRNQVMVVLSALDELFVSSEDASHRRTRSIDRPG